MSTIDCCHPLEGKIPHCHGEGRLEWDQWFLNSLSEDYLWVKACTQKKPEALVLYGDGTSKNGKAVK